MSPTCLVIKFFIILPRSDEVVINIQGGQITRTAEKWLSPGLAKRSKRKKFSYKMRFPSPLITKISGWLQFSKNGMQRVRTVKVATLEPGGLFKDYDIHKVESLEVSPVEMDAVSFNYWLTKFIQ